MSPERAAEGWLVLQETYPDRWLYVWASLPPRVLVGPATSLKPDEEMTWLDE